MFRDPDMRPIPGEPEPKTSDVVGGIISTALLIFVIYCVAGVYDWCQGSTSNQHQQQLDGGHAPATSH